MDSEDFVNRAEFEAFCDEQYPPGILSKTMRRERCERIIGWLKGIYSPPRGNWQYRIINRGYTLVSFPDLNLEDVLCLKGKEESGQIEEGLYKEWRRVVSVEEFYDILLDSHIRVANHGGSKTLKKALEKNYVGIPRAAVLKFVSMCTECRKNPRQQARAQSSSSVQRKVIKLPGITRDFNRRCQVDVIDMSLCPDGQYCYIGVYVDYWTKFVTLFPLTGGSPEHVACALVSCVYPYYGPPHFLHSAEGAEFAEKVVTASIEKWRGGDSTVVPRAKEGLMHMGGVMERTKDLLIQLVNARAVQEMVEGALPWVGWLGKIMYEINNHYNDNTGRSAFKRVFEKPLLFHSGETSRPARGSCDTGQSSSGEGTKRALSSSPLHEGGEAMTSFKTPLSVGCKRPRSFVAINSQR